MKPLAITAHTVTCAAGRGSAAFLASLRTGRTGLAQERFEDSGLATWVGAVAGLESVKLPASLATWDCRNNRLAELTLGADGFLEAVAAARARHGARRIGVFIGTSTSGVRHTELAYREWRAAGGAGNLPDWFDYRTTQNTFSIADFTRERLGLEGLASAVSAACASSAKVFASAARAIETGFCDAAVVGGVDSLCLTTLYGFNALQLVSSEICRPADATRKGLSIGEAGGFALLEPARGGELACLGAGESSDAHHMSQPRPDGAGAVLAMRGALGGLAPERVSYINLHGTATPANDASEDRAVTQLFGTRTPCSSTKGWTGHTLGAAGIVEAVVSLLALEHGFMPQSLNTRERDPALAADVLLAPRTARVDYVLSNSFGFGGTNCSVLFGRAP
jgi:3-oxoacyl-[acyl-carrier-protein] synthase-1